MTKIFNKCVFPFMAALLCGCSLFRTETRYVVQPMVKNPTSVVVCREKQCAPARLSMSAEYIHNSLLQLLQNNKGSKALVCNADPASHICTEEYITMPIKVGITPAYMYIDDVKITDVTVRKGKPMLDLVLNYNVTYNGQIPDCKPAKTLVFVESANSIMLQDNGYTCKMTAIGTSSVRTMFAIDYIDLDYGYIGGYYSIGMSGPANGGGAGYMMLRMPVNAYPLSPALKAPTEPALQHEVMIRGNNDMSLRTPATVNGRPVTKVIIEGSMPQKKAPSNVQIFPLYKKKAAQDVETFEATAGDGLKETTEEAVSSEE